MNCKINLFNTTNNKSLKTEIISGSYLECENQVKAKNERNKKPNQNWKLTEINI